ncbi:MAG: hypothetical protein ACTSRZ_01365 [Promethearchaeota archaeon]
MAKKNILPPKRGTKLYRNNKNIIKVALSSKENQQINLKKIMMIIGNTLFYGNNIENAFDESTIVINPFQEYMFINLNEFPIILSFSEDFTNHDIIYDPYYYEKESHINFNPTEFIKEHPDFPIPAGFIDTLPKWYSIKYTYPSENRIFVRPRVGLSFQTHKHRAEKWEVLYGSPIIISNSNVFYNTKPKDQFQHSIGEIHTIINPTDDWVAIIEKYEGFFDEKDIERIFNPNQYFDN